MRGDLSALSIYDVSIGSYVTCIMFLCLSLQEPKFPIYRDSRPLSLRKCTCYVTTASFIPGHNYESHEYRVGAVPTLLSWRNLTETHPIHHSRHCRKLSKSLLHTLETNLRRILLHGFFLVTFFYFFWILKT